MDCLRFSYFKKKIVIYLNASLTGCETAACLSANTNIIVQFTYLFQTEVTVGMNFTQWSDYLAGGNILINRFCDVRENKLPCTFNGLTLFSVCFILG